MRRAFALLLLTFALASPVGAAPPGAAPKPVAPKKAAPAPAKTAPIVLLPAPIPLATAAPVGDPGQCRATCARTYYFCIAQDDAQCPTQWSQCTVRCTATYKRAGL